MKRSVALCLLLCLATVASCSSGSNLDHHGSQRAHRRRSSRPRRPIPSTTATTSSTTTTTEAATTSSPTSSIPIDTTPTTTSATPIAADDWKAVLEELDRRGGDPLRPTGSLARSTSTARPAATVHPGCRHSWRTPSPRASTSKGSIRSRSRRSPSATVGEPSGAGQRIATVEFVIAPDRTAGGAVGRRAGKPHRHAVGHDHAVARSVHARLGRRPDPAVAVAPRREIWGRLA